MNWNIIIASTFILLGAYELFTTWRYFDYLKHHGNKNTSHFVLGGIWSALIVGIALILIGISGFFY